MVFRLVVVLVVLWGVECVVGLRAAVVFRLEGGLAVVVLAVLWGVGCVVGLLALVIFRLEGVVELVVTEFSVYEPSIGASSAFLEV